MSMKFVETRLKGAFVVEPDVFEDERGYFAPTWSVSEFEQRGLDTRVVQCNSSFNRRKGTLRGMHFQRTPMVEVKLVRCTRGSIYDVILDLRGESPTYKQWTSVVLNAENLKALYIPERFAHGFQTLEDDTEVLYQVSQYYSPEHAAGVRWDDPAFAIEWPPEDARTISERDLTFPDFMEITW
jgi:dTDP-4-dehydrorhamnose 3,5-epimerase